MSLKGLLQKAVDRIAALEAKDKARDLEITELKLLLANEGTQRNLNNTVGNEHDSVVQNDQTQDDDVVIVYYEPPNDQLPGFQLQKKDRKALVKNGKIPSPHKATTVTGSNEVTTHNRFSILGTGNENCKLKPVSYQRFETKKDNSYKVYVGRFDGTASEITMRHHLRFEGNIADDNIIDVIKMQSTRYNNSSSCSFCITVDTPDAERRIYNQSLWPENVVVRPFRQPARSKLGKKAEYKRPYDSRRDNRGSQNSHRDGDRYADRLLDETTYENRHTRPNGSNREYGPRRNPKYGHSKSRHAYSHP